MQPGCRCLSAECQRATSAASSRTAAQRQQQRAALILHGMSARSDGQRHLDADSFATLRRDWMETNPDFAFDVYFHSWTGAHEAEVVRIIQPKRWAFEAPKRDEDFFDFAALSAALQTAARPLKLSDTTTNISPEAMAARLFARFHSLARSVQLVGPAIDGYDAVLLSRFDVVSRTPLNLSALDLSPPPPPPPVGAPSAASLPSHPGEARLYTPLFSRQLVLEDASATCSRPDGQCSVYLDGAKVPLEDFKQQVQQGVFSFGVHDFFLVGSAAAARKMAAAADELAGYLAPGSDFLGGGWRWPVVLSGHSVVAYHARQQGIELRRLPLEEHVDFALPRSVRSSGWV